MMRSSCFLAVPLIVAISAAPAAAAPRGSFAPFAGSWSGSGQVVSATGSEAIRCRARSDVGAGGASISQRLVCASASYRFDITCRADDADGRISGTWTETTRGVTGMLTGELQAGQMRGVVSSPLFNAGLSLVTRGNRQDVVIAPEGNDVRQVSVQLRR
ncbi:hypothetical protein [Methylobacterium nonmethylotrophicum]|uniref:Uncharacterized protein n=1 Tax=Methylobacterium nonmethylotrophicum TaxID=1141884 RepID=A0A4Z0NME7_9HYPH|nr:hypothetical protein [Methylobacterium nonmethylotrophicum]TGD97739.1 hypothetical protein EU555_19125 [Methylobacterium nonmethylotrophicum]